MHNILKRFICFLFGHTWKKSDRNGGWFGIGGFPECDRRECVNCKYFEEK